MSTMTAARPSFREALQHSRQHQLDKKSDKALEKARRRGWTVATIQAVGQTELEGLIALGWKLDTQDMSEHGAWVRQYTLSRRVLGH